MKRPRLLPGQPGWRGLPAPRPKVRTLVPTFAVIDGEYVPRPELVHPEVARLRATLARLREQGVGVR